jgi:hypothetical protein
MSTGAHSEAKSEKGAMKATKDDVDNVPRGTKEKSLKIKAGTARRAREQMMMKKTPSKKMMLLKIENMVKVLVQTKMNTMKLMREKELDIKRDLNS